MYYADPAGDTLPNADGTQVAAQKGDIFIKSDSAQAVVKGIFIDGDLQFGKLGSSLYAKGGGSISLTQTARRSAAPPGFAWSPGNPVTATFSGAVSSGTTVVANASGTLDGKRLNFKGDATVTDPNYKITGAIEGSVYYGAPGAGTIEGPTGNQSRPPKATSSSRPPRAT